MRQMAHSGVQRLWGGLKDMGAEKAGEVCQRRERRGKCEDPETRTCLGSSRDKAGRRDNESGQERKQGERPGVRSRASGARLLCAWTRASLSSGRTVSLLCSRRRLARVGPGAVPGMSMPRLSSCYGTAGHDTQMSSLWTSLKSSGMN